MYSHIFRVLGPNGVTCVCSLQGNAEAWFHLGVMYLNGWGVKPSQRQAVEFFALAAQRGHVLGMYNLAMMHLHGRAGLAVADNKGSCPPAVALLKKIAEKGSWGALVQQASPICQAQFGHLYPYHDHDHGQNHSLCQQHFCELALMVLRYIPSVQHLPDYDHLILAGIHVTVSCCYSVLSWCHMHCKDCFLSFIRGTIVQKAYLQSGLRASMLQGYEACTDGDFEPALLHYLQAAEMGSEVGQSNAAWMLMHGYGYRGPHAAQLAISLYQKAAAQGNREALLHVGDSFYYGRGVPRDWTQAAAIYAEASHHKIAQAYYNLGFMHEYGAGLPQDTHLAKRYYDKALEAQPDAYLPIVLALFGLWVHSCWLSAKPYLPESALASWLTHRIFVVPEADQGIVEDFGGGSSPGMFPWAVLDKPIAWLSHAGAMVGLLTDQAELFLLLACGAGLWFVLQRRRRLRLRQDEAHSGEGPHNELRQQEPVQDPVH